MTCTPEQLAANRRNSEKSCGPKTEAGKEASRANGYKHGLTGVGTVQSPADAEATQALATKLRAEYKPTTDVGEILINRMALHANRLDRCYRKELAQLEAGEEVSALDGSRAAALAFKYEQAAERGLFRTLREFRQVEGRGPTLATAKRAHGVSSTELASSLKQLEELEATAKILTGQVDQPSKVTPVPNPKVEPSLVDLIGRSPNMPKLPTNCVNFSIGKKR